MAKFNGKWSLKEVTGGQEYFDAIKSPAAYKEKLTKLYEAAKQNAQVYVEEIKVDTAAGTLRRVTFINGEQKRDSGEQKFGVELSITLPDERPAKVKCELVSATKISRTEAGDGFNTTTTFELADDNNLVATAVGNGKTMVTKYQRQ